MKLIRIFIVNVFLLQTVSTEFDLNEVGCGYLLDNYLLDNSSISFSATSGDPGRPLLSGEPWKPTTINFRNSLTVDLGANYSVSQVVWSGDPATVEQTNQMAIQYSYDGITYDCRRKRLAPASCNPYYGNYPPPAPSQAINVVNLGSVVTARYFRFVPIEPDPGVKPGSHNLRIDVNGCVKGIPDIDLVFLFSSTSTILADATAAFTFMKNTAKEFVTQYGKTYIRYGLIVFGITVNDVFNFQTTASMDKATLKTSIDGSNNIAGSSDLKAALGNAKAMLQGPGSRPNARKIVVVMMDTGSAQSQNELELAAKNLRDIEALVIGIGIGRQIPVQQLEWITLNRYYVMLFPWTGSFRHLCFGIAVRCFKEFDITFAIGAGSTNSAALFKLMKDTMGAIVLKYGMRTIHYSIVTYGLGSASASVVRSFTSTGSLSSSDLKNAIDSLTYPGGSGTIATDAALNRCQSSFNDPSVQRSAEKDVVLMTDKSASISAATLRSLSYTLGASGLRIIPVGIGNNIDRNQLLAMSSNSEDVIHVTEVETANALELKVMHNVYR
ncbi:coadhesin-like, partial [Actinia tenebrosa]|uniref:Coadhesin-like n=1 Tax=Actinia tenebrosa TaxID=6105 RepID=A0A6P8HRA8_ACTTE